MAYVLSAVCVSTVVLAYVARSVANHIAALEASRVADLRVLLKTSGELARAFDRETVAAAICRAASELVEGTGAMLVVDGPGRPTRVASVGLHPLMPDAELGVGGPLERALRGGRAVAGDPLLVRLMASSGVAAVVSVSGPRRRLDDFTLSRVELFGWSAGTAFERFVQPGAHGRDPVSGVGDRAAASSALSALRPGDAVALFEAAGVGALRASSGDGAADLVQGFLGLHLLNAVRPGDLVARFDDESFVVVLRLVDGSVEHAVRRMCDTWAIAHPGTRLLHGAVAVLPGSAPVDVVENAWAALFSERRAANPPATA